MSSIKGHNRYCHIRIGRDTEESCLISGAWHSHITFKRYLSQANAIVKRYHTNLRFEIILCNSCMLQDELGSTEFSYVLDTRNLCSKCCAKFSCITKRGTALWQSTRI